MLDAKISFESLYILILQAHSFLLWCEEINSVFLVFV